VTDGPGSEKVVRSSRDRRREKTREEIGRIALRLCAAKGFNEVTVEEIAAEADYSTRSFFRYFAAKEDALFADSEYRCQRLCEALREQPAEKSVGDALRGAVLTFVGTVDIDTEHSLLLADLVGRTPALQSRLLLDTWHWERALAAVVAERLPPDAPKLESDCLAAAAVGAFRVAHRAWWKGGGTAPMLDLASQSLDVVFPPE
jgi:AcrR family transcriptional regulator